MNKPLQFRSANPAKKEIHLILTRSSFPLKALIVVFKKWTAKDYFASDGLKGLKHGSGLVFLAFAGGFPESLGFWKECTFMHYLKALP